MMTTFAGLHDLDDVQQGNALRLTIGNFDEAAANGWHPEIRDDALRSAIIGNRRLESRIVGDLASAAGVDIGDTPDLGADAARFAMARRTDVEKIHFMVGAALRAGEVAQVLTSGTASVHLPSLEAAVLRAALSVRSDIGLDPVAPEILADVLARDGRKAFSGWLMSLPGNAAARFCLLTGYSCDAAGLERSEASLSVVERCLDRLSIKIEGKQSS